MRLRTIAIVSLIALACVPSAQAGFTYWENPTQDYLGQTTLIDISGIPAGDDQYITGLSDGYQTLTFSAPLGRQDVPTGWETWGELPYVESVNPPVLFHVPGNGIRIDFGIDVVTFGIEISANPWELSEFSVQYLSRDPHIVGITRYLYSTDRIIDGYNGARLFAGSHPEHPFAAVLINGLSNDDGFAIAQIRYAVPEPASVIMIAQAIAVAGAFGFWQRRKMGKVVEA